MSAEKEYMFKVEMTCTGCSNAVTRVLDKAKGKGIVDFSVDLNAQRVTVRSTSGQEEVAEILKKTGKQVILL